ncbi:MAG TPA: hypothetical protein PKA95_09090 [Thermomicrobiales bacterium]|nr:hypothetical protein [Thermomicrobiales bacterium]
MARARTHDERPSLVLSFAAVLVLVLLLGACGEDDATGNGGSDVPASPTVERIDHPSGDDEMILRVAWEGGFVMPEELVRRLPLFALLGDGCVVTQGPQIEIFPQPALPNLQQTCLTEDGVQQILRAAKEAGLLDGDAQYDFPNIADAVTTVFTLTANGQTTTVKAYALGDATQSTGDAEADAAREKLAELQTKLGDLRSWLPADAFASEEQPYEVTRMQLVVQPVSTDSSSATPEGIEIQQLDWPLSTPLAEIGAPYPFERWRCVTVEGDDLATLMEQLTGANRLTQWRSGDAEYTLIARPLLPGEQSCANAL